MYYVQRIDHDNIKLGKSPANLYSSQFVSIETTTTVTDNILDQYDLRLKSLEPQKLYREISTPINTNVEVETKPGATGILAVSYTHLRAPRDKRQSRMPSSA